MMDMKLIIRPGQNGGPENCLETTDVAQRTTLKEQSIDHFN